MKLMWLVKTVQPVQCFYGPLKHDGTDGTHRQEGYPAPADGTKCANRVIMFSFFMFACVAKRKQ